MADEALAQVGLPEQTGAAAETPAAQPAVVETTPETQVPANGEAGKQQEQEAQQKQDHQGYIRRLQAQRARANAKAEQLAAELEALKAQQQARQTTDVEPKAEAFQDYNEFIDAKASFIARQEAQRALQAERMAQTQAQQQAEAARLNEAWEKRTDAARERLADFDESVDWLKGQVPNAVLPILGASELGPEILYYLGKHPEELERIQSLSPVLQSREAWALESKVKPAPKQTQAPKPIEPVKGSAAPGAEYRPDMTDEQFARWRAMRKGRKN